MYGLRFMIQRFQLVYYIAPLCCNFLPDGQIWKMIKYSARSSTQVWYDGDVRAAIFQIVISSFKKRKNQEMELNLKCYRDWEKWMHRTNCSSVNNCALIVISMLYTLNLWYYVIKMKSNILQEMKTSQPKSSSKYLMNQLANYSSQKW